MVNRIIVPHRRRILRVGAGGTASSWANWNEASENTLDVDQDGDGVEDTFIAFMENTLAGGDETGQGGGFSGADLVLSQNGNIAGASGSPPSRTLDGSDDYFTVTNTFRDWLSGEGTYGIIFKVEDWNPADSYECLFFWRDGNLINLRSTLNTRELTVNFDGTSLTTTNAMPTSGVLYCYVGCDGSDFRIGFSTTKPTKWSDFAANDRASNGSSVSFPSNTTNTPPIFSDSNYLTDRSVKGDAYYTIWSKTTLIDFSS